MNEAEFVKWANKATKWAADYRAGLRGMPVRPRLKQGEILGKLPESPPENAEDFSAIMDDFCKIVPDGLTHWQHPRFFAYFPANADLASVVAEHLTAAIAANCMLWQTSPVGTEMEIRMMEWLAQLFALPTGWKGVIQDTASSANFAAVVTAREKALGYEGLTKGLGSFGRLRFYMSPHSHSSAQKALMLAGIGKDNAVEVPTLESGSMDPGALQVAIKKDRSAGFIPAGALAVVGSTSTGVSDDLDALGDVVRNEGLYGHVDAAWAGSAMVCHELRKMVKGLEKWDSYVFNPHKWLGANFDVSAHFLKDPSLQKRAMSVMPHYLRTQSEEEIVDFYTWTAPLGRRFRALKLWFVIRSKGASGLREMIRNHIKWAAEAAKLLTAEGDFKLLGKPSLALFVFRHTPGGLEAGMVGEHNHALCEAINTDGFCYLTQTEVDGQCALRFQVGSLSTTKKDVVESIDRIKSIARSKAQ